jgi:hypothetical protein
MSLSERRILSKLNELQIKIKDLTNQLLSIPCLSLDGFQAISDVERDWQTNVYTFCTMNHIYKSWILNLVNPSGHTHPHTIQIQFINNIVRNQAYNALSSYIISNEYDCLICKEDIGPPKIVLD